MRSKYAEYKEYHTSLDDLKKVVTEKGLKGSLKMYKVLAGLIEKERFQNQNLLENHF